MLVSDVFDASFVLYSFVDKNKFRAYLLEKRSVLEKLALEVLSAYGVFYAKHVGYTVKFQPNWT